MEIHAALKKEPSEKLSVLVKKDEKKLEKTELETLVAKKVVDQEKKSLAKLGIVLKPGEDVAARFKEEQTKQLVQVEMKQQLTVKEKTTLKGMLTKAQDEIKTAKAAPPGSNALKHAKQVLRKTRTAIHSFVEKMIGHEKMQQTKVLKKQVSKQKTDYEKAMDKLQAAKAKADSATKAATAATHSVERARREQQGHLEEQAQKALKSIHAAAGWAQHEQVKLLKKPLMNVKATTHVRAAAKQLKVAQEEKRQLEKALAKAKELVAEP
jgi:hypothetical protein